GRRRGRPARAGSRASRQGRRGARRAVPARRHRRAAAPRPPGTTSPPPHRPRAGRGRCRRAPPRRDSTLRRVSGEPRPRRAHVGLAAIFVVFGTLGGNWDARLPAVRSRLGLDSGELGVVIFAVTLTATAALPLAGWLTSRLGSRGPCALGLLCAGAGISAAAYVPSYATILPAA